MTAPSFVEVKQTASAAIEVVLRSGHVLRVPTGFGQDTLLRVTAALKSPVGSY